MSDEESKKQRAERLRKKVGELISEPGDLPVDSTRQRPGESDAEYVHRRMREIERKPESPNDPS